jgi:hypothetical protein
MEVGSKVKRTFLSGIALCIISSILFLLGTTGLLYKTADGNITYFFVPFFFLATGIMAIVMSREKKSKNKYLDINNK